MLRRMSGVRKKGHVRHMCVRDLLKVRPINKRMRKFRLRWFGPVKCSLANHVGKESSKLRPAQRVEGCHRGRRCISMWCDRG